MLRWGFVFALFLVAGCSCTKRPVGAASQDYHFAHESRLAADDGATMLQCGGVSDTAAEAIYSLSYSMEGIPQTSVPNTNEAQTSAYVATPPAAAVIYAGNTAAMANNYAGSVFTQGSAYGRSSCSPDAAGKDAFLKFTTPGIKGVSPNVNIEIASLAASFDQTIALWDTTPMIAPRAASMNNDTRHAAFVASIGAIDDDWIVKSTSMASLMPDALTAFTPALPANDDVQDLGDPVGKRINVAGATDAPGVLADFPAATLGCGTSDIAPDMIYRLRPSANTTIRAALNNPSAPSFAAAIAVISAASGHPQRFSDTEPASTTTSYCDGSGFSYYPSNFTVGSEPGEANFATAPSVSLTCAGTITFNSSDNTWSNYCAGQLQPVAVIKEQSAGPELTILPFKSLSIGASTTLKLVGSRPVVFAVEGAADIAGTIDASSTSTSVGAGGNYACGTSAGGDRSGRFRVEGGGGGGFGTKGAGVGGRRDSAGIAGAVRGNTTLVPLLGGCNGGRAASSCSGSNAGNGGGALQISSGGTLTVSGTIKANGGAGEDAGCKDSGGAGGGSGGGILLEGAAVNITGSAEAHGGSGGKSRSNRAGSGGYGRIYSHVGVCVPPNDSTATATAVPIGLTQTFTSPTAGLASNLAGLPVNWGSCRPDRSGPDAFFQFTLTRTTDVEVSAKGTAYNHTLAIFNSSMAAQGCADGSSAEPSVIEKSLSAGTYYVGFKTRNGGSGGAYTLAFRDVAVGPPYATSPVCSTAGSVDAPLVANTDYYIIVKGASAGQAGTYNLTVTDIGAVQDFGCGTDVSAPDAYFDFSVSSPSRSVSIALNESSGKLDGAFQLMRDVAPLDDRTNDEPVASCQTNAFTYANLPTGRYYVIVRGTAVTNGAARRPAEITIRDESGMNALGCTDISAGASGAITSSLAAGTTYYAGITTRSGATGGSYKLRLRDTAIPVRRASCEGEACAAGAHTTTVTDVSSAQDVAAEPPDAGAGRARNDRRASDENPLCGGEFTVEARTYDEQVHQDYSVLIDGEASGSDDPKLSDQAELHADTSR